MSPERTGTPSAGDGGEAGRLLIIDGHAYAYRAFYAIRELMAPDGFPTNAIYGFIKMLAKIHSWLRPTHQVVIWDGGLASERMAALPEYKATRKPMPSDLEKQLDGIVEYLRGANIVSCCREGIEADDWIATLALRAAAAGHQVAIASSDKDFMQLVGPKIGLLNPNDKLERLWTAEMVLAKTGVKPEQIVDWLSLIGDSIDNIPGVPGVGSKTAADLINQFGSINELYRRLGDVRSDRLRANLEASRELVKRNQELIRLRTDIGGDYAPGEYTVKPHGHQQLAPLYSRWGFNSLLKEIQAEQQKQVQLL